MDSEHHRIQAEKLKAHSKVILCHGTEDWTNYGKIKNKLYPCVGGNMNYFFMISSGYLTLNPNFFSLVKGEKWVGSPYRRICFTMV